MHTSVKYILLVLFSGLLSGCSCHTRRVEEPRATLKQPVRAEYSAQGLSNIYYAFDSYELSQSSRRTLEDNAAWLRNNRAYDIKVEGHADERGTHEYNLVLGRNRAEAAAEYLRSLGIDDNRMSIASYGEEMPASPEHNETAWAKNRRVEFVLPERSTRPSRAE